MIFARQLVEARRNRHERRKGGWCPFAGGYARHAALALAVLPLVACGSDSESANAPGLDAAAGGSGSGGETGTDPQGPQGPFKRLAVGYSGACILDDQNRVACWGQNPHGETGVAPNFTASLRIVEEIAAATQIVMGNTHACALDAAGEVYCWGSNLHNQLGRPAGSGGDVTCSLPGHSSVPCSWVPVRVAGLPPAVSITASVGFDQVCALAQDGSAYCWGEAISTAPGAVACGDSQADRCFTMPTQIEGVSGLVDLATGGEHACGNTNAGLICWGNNTVFEVSPEPCPDGVCSTPILRADVGALTGPPGLGLNTTCIQRENGELACFGRNDYAQLAHAPGTSGDSQCPYACNATASVIPSLTGAVAISPTSEYSWCAIASDRRVYCWGTNATSELGHPRGTEGDVTCESLTSIICNPTPSLVPDVTGATAVAVGHWMACAIDGSGALWCWGGDNDIPPTRIGP